MCTTDEDAARRKCFPSLSELPCQDALAISRIAGMLYRFRSIPEENLSEVRGKAKLSISNHIREYHKKTSLVSANTPNNAIAEICSYAADLLEAGDADYDSFTSISKNDDIVKKLRFQEKWLSNVKLMVPEDEEVIKILPFLLICHYANAPIFNKLDPFKYHTANEEIINEDITPGWCEVFQEYRSMYKGRNPALNQNLKRNVNTLARYFTQFPISSYKPNVSSILSLVGIASSYMRFEVEKCDMEKGQSSFLKTVVDWELYRWFAALCDACDEYEHQQGNLKFNLTLSMALFSQCWTLKPPHDVTDKVEDDESTHYDICVINDVNKVIHVIEDPKPIYYDIYDVFEDDKLIHPVSWADIERDCLRTEVLEVARLQSCEGTYLNGIHDIVQKKKRWLFNAYNPQVPEYFLPLTH